MVYKKYRKEVYENKKRLIFKPLGQKINHMIKNLTKSEFRVLEHFFLHPDKEIHLRGFSTEIGIPYSTVRNSLGKLEEKGLLESEEKGNLKFYSKGDEKFLKSKKTYNIEKILGSNLAGYLEKELKPEAIVLFGSYLEGRDTEESDIDIAVVDGRKKEPDLTEFEEKLGRKIQLVYTGGPEDEKDEFINTLANGLVLKGFLKVR